MTTPATSAHHPPLRFLRRTSQIIIPCTAPGTTTPIIDATGVVTIIIAPSTAAVATPAPAIIIAHPTRAMLLVGFFIDSVTTSTGGATPTAIAIVAAIRWVFETVQSGK